MMTFAVCLSGGHVVGWTWWAVKHSGLAGAGHMAEEGCSCPLLAVGKVQVRSCIVCARGRAGALQHSWLQ